MGARWLSTGVVSILMGSDGRANAGAAPLLQWDRRISVLHIADEGYLSAASLALQNGFG